MKYRLDCTLIIPSRNRHQYLKRIFDYYDNADFGIVCCDSSDNKYVGCIPNNTVYIHCPGLNFKQKMFKAISESNTRYIVCCPDDDFVIKKAIKDGVKFLDLNHSYNSVVGGYLGFLRLYYDRFYKIYGNSFYEPKDNPVSNMQNFMKNYYMILWGLYRKNDILKAYEIILKSDFKNDNFLEFIIGSYLSYKGNIKYLDQIWGIREIEFVNTWGRRHKILCREKQCILQNDIRAIKNHFDLATEKDLFEKAMDAYMGFCNPKACCSIKTLFFNSLPKALRYFLYRAIKSPSPISNSELLEINYILNKHGV